MRHAKYITLLCIIMMLSASCRKKGPTASERIKSALRAGWENFEAERFTAAENDFWDAFAMDSSRAESQVGLGWARFMIPGTALTTVLSAIDSNATDNADWQTDAWCLLASVNLSRMEYGTADSLAALTLSSDTSYVFLHRPEIDWQDLLVVRGQALFFMAEYDSSWTVMMPLTDGTSHSSIDPDDETTWSITIENNTITYTIFAEVLARVISDLAEQYR
ncbi:MAG: hypothetical protein KAU50_02550 [Candidatus Marinimicrobia bacterium]|nr:hypothetical protein [Candidatus Neomarinimicrobiota bacterium]